MIDAVEPLWILVGECVCGVIMCMGFVRTNVNVEESFRTPTQEGHG